MKRIHLIVEGETERSFISNHIAPAFAVRGDSVDAILIGVPGKKGGNVRWSRLLPDIRRCLLGDRTAYTSTLFDFFRMGTDFPGGPHATLGTIADKHAAVLQSMSQGLADAGIPQEHSRRFVPYVQLHEFEGLLFSEPGALARAIGREELAARFSDIRSAYETPEHINGGAETAPSRRLTQVCGVYSKVQHGANAAAGVGLPAIRRECRLFDEWLRRLESLPPLG